MRILALETSCDETAVAIVEDGRRLVANVVYSQTALHARFGGVVPEEAAREHLNAVNDCIAEALSQSALSLEDMDAFAATLGPGLVGSLLVGANAGKSLSLLTGKPFRGVHHLQAHVASNYLESDLAPPFLCLLVSGGHTQLIHVRDYGEMEIIGETLDDAVGEAYDKIARMMGLPFPGGPNLDKLAATGNPKAFTLPNPSTTRPWDFSFSGLKTACLRAYEKALTAQDPANPDALAALQRDLSASFQHRAVEILFHKTLKAAEHRDLTTIAIAGGVSANRGLRQRFSAFVEKHPAYQLFIPKLEFCTDNAAMVAAAAYFTPLTDDLGREVFSRDAAALRG